MRRASIPDIALSIGVLALVALALMPAVARMQRSLGDAKCQSNLQRWADAMALYCADNNGTFPTNRARTTGGLGNIVASAALSPDPPPSETPAPPAPLQVYSVNWVEALYTYVWHRGRGTGQDWKSFRRCPKSSQSTWPIPNPTTGYPFPSVTYILNCNLVERPSQTCRNSRKVMMLREFWQTTIAELRPVNNSTGNPNARPQYPFLNGDVRTISGNADAACKLHGEGSYIVFADGHVHFFTTDYYPKYMDITAASSWDAETQQWWNFAPGSGKSPPYLKSIAITP